MRLQAILPSAALAAVMVLSGPSFAQEIMLDDVVIPEDQVQLFRDRCAALHAASLAPSTADDDSTGDDDEMTTGSVTGQSSSGDPASQDYWDEALASVTLEECRTAGLL